MRRYPQPAEARPRPAASASSQAGARRLALQGQTDTSWRTARSLYAGAPAVHLSARHTTAREPITTSVEVQAASRTQTQDERMLVGLTPRRPGHAPRSQLVSFLPFPGSRRDIPLRRRSRVFFHPRFVGTRAVAVDKLSGVDARAGSPARASAGQVPPSARQVATARPWGTDCTGTQGASATG